MRTMNQKNHIQSQPSVRANRNIVIFLMTLFTVLFTSGWAQCNFYAYALNQTICLGDSTYIKIGPDSLCQYTTFTYTWIPGNIQGQHATVAPVATTEYTVTAVDQNGNAYTTTLHVYVNACSNNCAINVNANPTVICLGSSTVLNAITDSACYKTYSFTWEPGNLSGQSATVSPVSSTAYTLTAIDQNGDTTVVTVPVFVNNCGNNCVVSAYSANQTICLGDSTILKAYPDSACFGNTYTYTWEPGSLSGQYALVSPVATTEYTLTATDQNGMSQVSKITVFVNNCNVGLMANLSASNSTICLGDSTTLYANISGGVPPYLCVWTPGNLSGSIINVSPIATTMYTLMVMDSNGDTVVTTIPVYVTNCENKCIADFLTYDKDSNIISFTNLSTSASYYFWSFGDGSISTDQDPVHQYLNAGTYTACLVIVNCDQSCIDQVCRLVTVGEKKKEDNGKKSSFGKGCDIKVFPNPANNNLSVNYTVKEETNVEVNITDVLGNKILVIENSNKNAGAHSIDYNVNDLINGIYMVNLVTNGEVVSKRLVVAK